MENDFKGKWFSRGDSPQILNFILSIIPCTTTLIGCSFYLYSLLSAVNIQYLECSSNGWLCRLDFYSNFIYPSLIICFLYILALFLFYSKTEFLIYVSLLTMILSFLCIILSYIFLFIAFNEGSLIKQIFSNTPFKWIIVPLFSFTSKYNIFCIFFYSIFSIIFAAFPKSCFNLSNKMTFSIFTPLSVKYLLLLLLLINTFIPSILFFIFNNSSLISFSLV